MPRYVVFSDRILTGTVSDLSPTTRLAWIAILFEADKLRGRVHLPVFDLAKMASITRAEAAEALRILQEPDPYSNSKVADGRRLLPVAGEENWYTLPSWEQHVEERQRFFDRLRQQRRRDKADPLRDDDADVTTRHAASRKEPEPESEEKKEPPPTSGVRKKTTKTLLDEGWEPKNLAEADRPDFESMRDWARSNAIRKADWEATWRNWKRNPNYKHIASSPPAVDDGYASLDGSWSPRRGR